LAKEPPLFDFQQRQRNSIGWRIIERSVAGDRHPLLVAASDVQGELSEVSRSSLFSMFHTFQLKQESY
jgi:hypothetical protein